MISDAKNWPAMGTRSLAGYQQKKVWINDGAGRFIDVAQMVGATDRYDGRSVALGDFSGQGTLDVVVANQRGPLLFYRNEVAPGRKWIAFALEGGCVPSRLGHLERAGSAPTAAPSAPRSRSCWNGQRQIQEVSGGSGFCSQNQRRLHFGLGADAKVDKVVVRWPSGKMSELTGPAVNQLHAVKEPA